MCVRLAAHAAMWGCRPEWHPALGRMLWDLVEATQAAGWATFATLGVPRPEPAGGGAIG